MDRVPKPARAAGLPRRVHAAARGRQQAQATWSRSSCSSQMPPSRFPHRPRCTDRGDGSDVPRCRGKDSGERTDDGGEDSYQGRETQPTLRATPVHRDSTAKVDSQETGARFHSACAWKISATMTLRSASSLIIDSPPGFMSELLARTERQASLKRQTATIDRSCHMYVRIEGPRRRRYCTLRTSHRRAELSRKPGRFAKPEALPCWGIRR